jgi:hypothetical protein
LSLCRAIGIICFIITAPYWKIAADNEISAIQMDSTLLQVKSNSFSGLTGSVGSSESETLF